MISDRSISLIVIASEARQSSSVLNLFQTQSPYWQAIQVSQKDLLLPSWLLMKLAPLVSPYLPKLTPANTNLWHNSWALPEGNSSLVIVYLPQYLEFLGLTLLILTPMVAFIIHLLRHRTKKPRPKPGVT